MIKLKDMLNKDVTLGKVYTDKDKPPFQVKEEKLDEALKKIVQETLVSTLAFFIELGLRFGLIVLFTIMKFSLKS